MIVTPAVGASLRPFSFVIFTANFLSDRRVEHIKDAKEKTAKMGEVGDAPSRSPYRREEFDEAENDDKVFGRNGEQKVDVDEPIGKEPTEGEKDSVDGSGGAYHRNALVLEGSEKSGTKTCTDSTEQKISYELFRSKIVFQLSSEHPEGQEVEEDMEESSVKKNVRAQLPQEILIPNETGDQGKVVNKVIIDFG